MEQEHEDFKFEIVKLSDNEIRVNGDVHYGDGFYQNSRIFLAVKTIPQLIEVFLDPGLIEQRENEKKTVENDIDKLEFYYDQGDQGLLLSVTGDHVRADGTVDQFGILDIPLRKDEKGETYSRKYPDLLAEELKKFV
ncbi:MAG: hypothetical protein GY754_35355 [bacterium]|nr:hypothetical protein [bacterium]